MQTAEIHLTDQCSKSRFLNILNFLREMMHYTPQGDCDQCKLGSSYIYEFGHILLTFKRNVCSKAGKCRASLHSDLLILFDFTLCVTCIQINTANHIETHV